MKYFLILIVSQIIYYNPPKQYVSNEVLESYFSNTLKVDEEVQVLPARSMININQLEKRLDSLFPAGHYINLEDSLVQVILEKNHGPKHWYSKELEEYPKSYTDVFLTSGTDGIIGYNFVMMLDKKGKIVKIEKWGYGM